MAEKSAEADVLLLEAACTLDNSCIIVWSTFYSSAEQRFVAIEK